MLYGDPEMLKTTLAMTLAALLSRNRPLPGTTRALPDGPLATIFFTWEDGRADTLTGRAIAAGADGRLIRVYEDKLPSIPDDLDVITRAVERVERETSVKVGLIVIDPLAAALGGKVDSHNNSSSRRALSPLKVLAQRLGVAILLIDHTNKTVGQKAIHRISGSAAFIAAVRIGLLAGWDPDDTEPDPNKRRRALARAKGNIGARPPALLYMPRAVLMDETGADLEDTEVAIDFVGESTVTADAMVAPPESESARRDVGDRNADDLLIDELANRPRPVRVIEALAKEAGISRKALDRARRELAVVSRRRSSDGVWFWSLKDSMLRCTEEEVAETVKGADRARRVIAAKAAAAEKLVAHVAEEDKAGRLVSKEAAGLFVESCGVARAEARSLVAWERERWHLEKAGRRGGGWRLVLGPEPSPRGDDPGGGET